MAKLLRWSESSLTEGQLAAAADLVPAIGHQRGAPDGPDGPDCNIFLPSIRVGRVVGGWAKRAKSVAPPQISKILKSGPKCAPGCCGTELLWQDHDWTSLGTCREVGSCWP